MNEVDPHCPPLRHSAYDIVIVGGGLAGLTIAIQLRKALPGARIVVLERVEHPVKEAAFKVGESTVEVGARYYAEVVGMKDHLETRHLRKMALRYFFPAGVNREITKRVEVGAAFLPAIPAYQIDRGRFENELALQVVREGAEFRDDTIVKHISFGQENHTIVLQDRNQKKVSLTARWVVDASGRAGVIKRQLKLGRHNSHDVNASWWRIAESVAIDDWSEARDWQARVPSRKRVLSTNHLMGKGYWVWLIPLASSSTSFGIVADSSLHPFDRINTFERALQWLWQYEPQCAAIVESRRSKLQDFRVMKHFSHECSRVFSADRWALTGEAGVFLDPFYSPGSDFIAISNTYITDLIVRDQRGEDIRQRVDYYNSQLLSFFHNSLLFYNSQYPLMGNPQVMTAKLVWDTAAYWAALALLFFHDKFCDLEFMHSIHTHLLRFARLNLNMQMFFREWHELDQGPCEGIFVNLQNMDFLYNDIYGALTAGLDDVRLKARLSRNLRLLETLAAVIWERVEKKVPGAIRAPLPAREVRPHDVTVAGMDRIWLTGEESSSAEFAALAVACSS